MKEEKKIAEITEDNGRKLQLALINALYKQISEDPTGVPAATLAVAERMLARWNLGLVELPEEKEMTEAEIEMIKQFEKLNLEMESEILEKETEGE